MYKFEEDDEWSEWDEEDEDTNEESEEEHEKEKNEETEDLGIAEGLKGGIGPTEPSQPTPFETPTLEDIAEQPTQQEAGEESSFSEFMLSPEREMPTATLPTSDDSPTISQTPEIQQPDNLEQIGAASSIGTPIPPSPAPTPRETDYLTVYNQPDYTGSAGSNEKIVFDNMSDRGMSTRTIEEMRNVQPRVMIEEWHEIGAPEPQRTGENLRDYVVLEPGRKQELDHKKLPFEERTKYKELKRERRIT